VGNLRMIELRGGHNALIHDSFSVIHLIESDYDFIRGSQYRQRMGTQRR
jgi:hypothetical protein